MSNYPENLQAYYDANPALFEERTNALRKIIYYVGIPIGIFLMIKPEFIHFSSLMVRVIAGVLVLYCGFRAFYGGKGYINKASGGKIKNIRIKKFNSSVHTDEEITVAFNSKDFNFLAAAQSLDNQPVQLYVDEDATGKVYYCQLRKHFTSSDFGGFSNVLVIAEPEYTQFSDAIKRIENT